MQDTPGHRPHATVNFYAHPVPKHLDDALCIRQWDWSETSQTVSLFTREHGVVRALAKGSKRPKGLFSGGIELLSLGQASFILKAGADLALLTSWDLLETYPALRRSLKVHHAGLYVADLIHHFVTDHDPHAGLFDATLGALREIGLTPPQSPGGEPTETDPPLLKFQWAVLVETGYRPVLDAAPAEEPTLRFSPSAGGLVSAADAHDPAAAAWPVRSETIGVLRRLAAGGVDAAGLGTQAAVHRANRLLAAYIRSVLGREPATLPIVFGSDLPR